jgi:hypothetical protein
MESSSPVLASPPVSSPPGDWSKNAVIIVLVVILLLSLLGVNILTLFGNMVEIVTDIFRPAVSAALANLGYASGTLLDRSSDVVADASKTGIDILHGTVDSVGDLLIKASGQGSGGALDKHINQPPMLAPSSPLPNATTSPIQSGGGSAKSHWCLVGEYNGTRGCVSVGDQDKCLSGQVFPSQQQCLNPTLSQNRS